MSTTQSEVAVTVGAQRGAPGMRVLMGVPAPGARGGGPALHLPMLVEDLCRDARFEVRTFAYGRWNEGESMPVKIAHQLLDLARYPLLLARHAPDLVHLNSAFDRKAIVRDLAFAILTRLARKRLLVKWHGSETELLRAPLWRTLSRALLACTHAIVVLTSEERRDLRQAGYTKAVPVVKNGLDLSRYAERGDIRPRFGLAPDATVLLFIARLIAAKGLHDSVEAMALLRSPAAHLVVVGDGPARAAAERRVEALGLGSRVHFAGSVSQEEARDYYCGSDILVFPTHLGEGLPMSIFQAVAGGMSIVTTRIRAAADHLREPANCLFVPARDPRALAQALQRLLDEPPLRDRMARNNRELAERFDRHRVADEFGEVYENVATNQGGSTHDETASS